MPKCASDMIHPKQVRAARGLLGISQLQLSDRAGVGVATIKRFERMTGKLRITVDALMRIQQALEAEGIMFIEPDDDHGFGVRLKDPGAR